MSYAANWTPNNYTISYNLNGGTCDSLVTDYNADELPLTLPTPTKANYNFVGWYASEDLSGSAVNEITIDNFGNTTLYAKWSEKDYGITYHLDGGANAPGNPSTYRFGSNDVQLNNPTKEGYDFAGWYLTEDFSGDAVTAIVSGTSGNVDLSPSGKKKKRMY